MKKKLVGLLGLLTILSLSSCIQINPYVRPTSENPTTEFPSSSSTTSGKSTTGTPTSGTPAPGGLVKTKLNYTYDDYVDYHGNSTYPISNAPLSGDAHLLVIPIWFTDSTSYISTSKKETVRSKIQTAYFGTNEETGWRSVKTYYSELSGGRVNITGTVANWYSASIASSAATQDKTMALVAAATDSYFTNNPSDSRLNYDKDGDGWLDAVILIYGAPDYGASGSSNNNLWAYCYWLQESSYKNTERPGPNVFFWASYDFMFSYGSDARAVTGSDYGFGDTTYCNVDAHTYIHEMGHVFGLEDYYDYSNQYTPCGGFSMQDSNVGSHDPYSVMAYGWADPYIPTESMTITIKPFQSDKDLILLSNKSVNSPFDEYLLLEYYTPTGLNEFDTLHKYCESSRGGNYPQGPDASGIRVWHVDARLTRYSGYTFTKTLFTNPTKYSAGNVYTAMSNTYYDEDNTEITGYYSRLGEGYYDYNLLQLIRNSSTANYRPQSDFASNSLFKKGAVFNMATFGQQFVNTGKLNSDSDLGWSFKVDNITSSGATITLTKLA